jgi:hypothetical protein
MQPNPEFTTTKDAKRNVQTGCHRWNSNGLKPGVRVEQSVEEIAARAQKANGA